MSIWARIRESLSALAAGEPLSAILERLTRNPERSVGFTIAVIALGAKMAKADGTVTRDEIAAFRRVFTIPPEAEKEAARLYNHARTDVAGFDGYARQVRRMFADRPEMLADLLEGLTHIAAADGEYHPGEQAFLEEVAGIFGIGPAEFRAIRARQFPDEFDPYEILGIRPGTSPEAARARYRKLVRELHPDTMVARGVPEEARQMAEARLARINEAWATLRVELAESSRG